MSQVRATVRRTWLKGGVLPLGLFLLLSAAVGHFQLGPQGLTPKRTEDTFEAILAISALVFLIAFSLDGYWASPERLGAALERSGAIGEPVQAATQAAEAMTDTASALTLMGNAIGAAAVLATYTGGNASYGMQLILLGGAYCLFLLSRHQHYYELVEAAADGSLLVPPEEHPAVQPQEADNNAP